MAAILRWFHRDGVRHRAYMRYSEVTARRELVVAGLDWEAAKPATRETLEAYTEDELVRIAATLHAITMSN